MMISEAGVYLEIATYQRRNKILMRDASLVTGRIDNIQINIILDKIEIKYTNSNTQYITYCDYFMVVTD